MAMSRARKFPVKSAGAGILFAFALSLAAMPVVAAPIATFEVDPVADIVGVGVPVQVDLEGITVLPASRLTLMRISGTSRTSIPFQIEEGGSRILHWILQPAAGGASAQKFELVEGKGSPDSGRMNLVEDDGLLIVREDGHDLLGYHFGIMPAPEGENPLYARSGFIHPLWSPHGQVLTRIQPPDHFHHYGIWNPWTHVLFEGEEVDFWNIGGGQGTVRFADFVSKDSGPVYGGYTTFQEHVVFHKDGTEKVALNEHQTVRIYRPAGPDSYLADVTIEMECASESPFKILEYRYAGFGWRATEQWNNENSDVLTSEGKTRVDADGSRARWYMIQGAVDDEHAGVVMMSSPENFNHPEPLRIWPPDNHEGAVFAMFAPTKTTDWLLEPGRKYFLKYRMLVFNGEFDAKRADEAWLHYGEPPRVKVTKN
jgi:hypothetical protein